MNKKNIPFYIKTLLGKHPKIFSGRKNFKFQHQRIVDTVKLIKKYYKIK